MNVSMWSQYLQGLPVDEMPAAFAEHGFKTLELSDEHGRELLESGGDPETTGREFRELATDHGISFPQGHLWLCADIVEPEESDRAATIERMTAIVDAVDSEKLGHCLDTGHLNMIGGDQGAYIRKCGAKLIALHIADNLGEYDNHMLPHSVGTVDWIDVVAALRDIGYSGLFNFEVPGESRCSLEIRLAKLDYAFSLGNLMIST